MSAHVATNGLGTGPASAASNTVVLATVPCPPVIQGPIIGNGSISVALSAPANNGGSAIISYTASCVSSNGGAAGSASGPSSPIVVSALTNGKTYMCSVTATNGVGQSGASAATAALVAAAPIAPTGVTATAGAGSAMVSWVAPANNNGSAVTGYVVRTFVGAAFIGGQTFNSTATTQTITGLTAGTTYTFKVAAVNARGTGAF
jgi:hypothetical protein